MSRLEELENARVVAMRALALGGARKPIEVPPSFARAHEGVGNRQVLGLAAALAWRGRLDRPALPARLQDTPPLPEQAKLVPGAVRSALRQVFREGIKQRHAAVARCVLVALESAGRVLHPFDYPALSGLMRRQPALLDGPARRWLGRGAGSDEQHDYDAQVSADNWTEFTPAVRVAFIAEQRARDAAAARELLAASLGSETAATRAKLTAALATGLGADDIEFLRGLNKDRAASVRALAASMLARIVGTDEYVQRLAAAHAQLKVRSALLAGKRRVIEPQFPSQLGQHAYHGWLEERFDGVQPTALARALELEPKQFVAAISDTRFGERLCFNALAAGDMEMAAGLAPCIDFAAGALHSRGYAERLQHLSAEQANVVWAAAVATRFPDIDQAIPALADLYELLECHPPDALGVAMLQGTRWRQWRAKAAHTEFDSPQSLEALVAVLPPLARAQAATELQALSPAVAGRALALARLLELITNPNHEG